MIFNVKVLLFLIKCFLYLLLLNFSVMGAFRHLIHPNLEYEQIPPWDQATTSEK